ncbi:MAG: hypothetical protein ACPHCI_00350 [Solirubrobacterales bacterium]
MSGDETQTSGDTPPQSGAERYAAARSRSEAKNQAVRDQLEPLAPGERPLAVTIASITAMLFAIGNLVSFLLTNDATGDDESRAVIQLALICAILFVASVGMWLVKYWAVIGFQTILGLQIIVYSLSLTRVDNAWVALLFVAIIVLSGVLFWFLIRAMARIQMPEAPDIQSLKDQREAAEAAALQAVADHNTREKQSNKREESGDTNG